MKRASSQSCGVTKRGNGERLAGLATITLLATNAQAAEESRPFIQEIIVTAEKREATLQDTPLSVTALNSEMLGTLGLRSATDLASYVPNLSIGQSRNEVIVNIRGVQTNNTNDVSDPAVAVHLDGVYLSRPRGANALLFDTERVEVLRGPQGTLYGRNATAGNINVVSKKPENRLAASGEVVAGNYDRIGTRGVVNVPLVDDKLLFRAGFVTEKHDGYNINDRVVPGIRNSDDADEKAFRAHLLYKPTDDLSILLSGRYQEIGGVGPGESFLNIVEDPGDPRVFSFDTQPELDADTSGVNAEINWDLGATRMTYIGAWYEDNVNNILVDLDQTVPFGSNPVSNGVFGPRSNSAEVVTHELRFASADADARFGWLAGVYVFDEDVQSELFVTQNPAVRTQRYNQRDVRSESRAVFGQLNFRISDAFELVGGLRYTDDLKTRDGETSNIAPDGTVSGITPTDGRAESTSTDWKAGLNWRPDDDSLYYVQVSTGYKGGGFNNNGAPYSPESARSYEIGTKNTLFDSRVRLNAAAFYLDYTDLQVTAVSVVNGIPGTLTRNAAEATIYGFELEGQVALSATALLDVGVGYLHAEYDEFVSDDPITPGVVPEDLSGNTLTKAPTWRVSLGAQQEFTLGALGTLTPRLQFRYEDDVYLREFNKPTDMQGSFTKTDLVITYRSPSERFFVAAYGNNLEDKDVKKSMGNLPGHGLVYSLEPPRTYGLRVGFDF